jgi:hypothetical protein
MWLSVHASKSSVLFPEECVLAAEAPVAAERPQQEQSQNKSFEESAPPRAMHIVGAAVAAYKPRSYLFLRATISVPDTALLPRRRFNSLVHVVS